MIAYTVYEEKDAHRLPLDERVDALAFVKDGFRWSAFLFSGLWLAIRGYWRALAAWGAALVAIGGLIVILGLGTDALLCLWLALAIMVGFEAAGLERESLEQDEAREIGYVAGRSRTECELTAVSRFSSLLDRERTELGANDV